MGDGSGGAAPGPRSTSAAPPPNRANTTPAKIAGPLSMACRAPFLPFAGVQSRETDTRGRRTGEPGVNAEPTGLRTHPSPAPGSDRTGHGFFPVVLLLSVRLTVHAALLKPWSQSLWSTAQPYTTRSDPGAQADSNLLPHSLFALSMPALLVAHFVRGLNGPYDLLGVGVGTLVSGAL